MPNDLVEGRLFAEEEEEEGEEEGPELGSTENH